MRTFVILTWLAMVAAVQAADQRVGSISGVVYLSGHVPEIPSRTPVFNTDVCGTAARTVPSLMLGTNQAVANVIVYLGVSTGSGAPTNVPAVLNAIHCELEPRIQIMGSGAPLILRNSDPTLHVLQIEMLNATNPPTMLLKTALPYAGFEKHFNLEHFLEPKILKVVDGNDEDGVVAYMAVLPQAWSALTDGQGRFVINGIPPGKYKICFWHEVLGAVTRDVNVTAERTSTLRIELTVPTETLKGGTQ